MFEQRSVLVLTVLAWAALFVGACDDDDASEGTEIWVEVDTLHGGTTTSGFANVNTESGSTGGGNLDCSVLPEGATCDVGWLCIAGRCQQGKCGDGWTTSPETCDDGNRMANDGCSPHCRFEFCGDGVKQNHEGCDDGNHLWGDGCSPDCRITVLCGNGKVEPGEECDDSNSWSNDGCSSTCKLENCGNGTVDDPEECDDGNREDGDGCSSMCVVEGLASCGDGIKQNDELCDDGNTIDGDGCSADCQTESPCGDGQLQVGEECDDGNNVNDDGCTANCMAEHCGDGIVQSNESCDDGNVYPGDGCSWGCDLENCGDGKIDIYEGCDDGNREDGDGCSAKCQKEDVCGARPRAGVIKVSDFHRDFSRYCGPCHTTIMQGGIQVTGAATMAAQLAGRRDQLLSSIQSDNQDDYMPPSGDLAGPWSNRAPGDPIVVFASQLNAWFAQGRPADEFTWPDVGGDDGGGDDGGGDDGSETEDDSSSEDGGDDTGCPDSKCGNGVVDEGEECDDGNTLPMDGCSSACLREAICGDGVREGAEECDDNNLVSGDGCDVFCKLEVGFCGDGHIEPPEICDDGNQDPNDGCSPMCRLECGDRVRQANEECDDGNRISGDGCSKFCVNEVEGCTPIDAKPLPVRSSVIDGSVGGNLRYVADLHTDMVQSCSCHSPGVGVEMKIGSSFTSLWNDVGEFATTTNDHLNLFKRMELDGGAQMPPNSKHWSERAKNGNSDPVYRLHSQLTAWIEQGHPDEVYEWPTKDERRVQQRTDADFVPTAALNETMTKIGSCRPNVVLYEKEATRSRAKDTLFAGVDSIEDLPLKLSDTDLFSFDSRKLAAHGVLSFSPGYPLWADNAAKVRHFKLPHGQKVEFDQENQQFELPDNTRFYKTFMKKVYDLKGKQTYRKLETRIIVVRRDQVGPKGESVIKAVFGTYRWNHDETEATLVLDTLRNGQPFADTIFPYETDELLAARIIDEGPQNIRGAMLRQNALRDYAIPGGLRCIECHMGSPMENFTLGFTPLQLLRRHYGLGGVVDPPYPGELGQLQHFIELEIFEGLESPTQIKLLEHSQGDRKPRTQEELRAQGYILGNCSHCHNPRGFPSVQSPDLADILDFYPSESGGVFEFPLDRSSPRIKRGPNGAFNIPYLSPAMYDMFGQIRSVEDPAGAYEAPWRSLIYRNIDTPYSYSGGETIFPKMPLHTPGYDCRIREIIGEWVLSIPSRYKDGVERDDDPDLRADKMKDNIGAFEQPFEEVYQSDSDYAAAVGAAQQRIQDFHASKRFLSCEEGQANTLDEAVRSGSTLTPVPRNEVLTMIPSTPHYTAYDPTELPPPWNPRGLIWKKKLVDKEIDCETQACEDDKEEVRRRARERMVIEEVEKINFDDPSLKELAIELAPQGLWQDKEECNLAGSKFARLGSDFSGTEKDNWPWLRDPKHADKHIYMASAGGMVFSTVCANCHGRAADSSGRMALTVSDMTAGRSRVANFREGLFGPAGHWGNNRRGIFGTVEGDAKADLWAARYMTWMALGGTTSPIPEAVLNLVNGSRWVQEPRLGVNVKDANMLEIARQICKYLLPGTERTPKVIGDDFDYDRLTSEFTLLGRPPFPHHDLHDPATKPNVIPSNGDAETWRRICTFDNPMPVRVITPQPRGLEDWSNFSTSGKKLYAYSTMLFRRESYPADLAVVDRQGVVHERLTDNVEYPWCIKRPTDNDAQILVDRILEENLAQNGKRYPYCPEDFFKDAPGTNAAPYSVERGWFSFDDQDRWAIHGAANAGMIVYTFLREMFEGTAELPPAFNECEKLNTNAP